MSQIKKITFLCKDNTKIVRELYNCQRTIIKIIYFSIIVKLLIMNVDKFYIITQVSGTIYQFKYL